MFAVTKIQIFESNSQHGRLPFRLSVRCSPSQRYKFLKAIHNRVRIQKTPYWDVRRHKDTNFWKQFTTQRRRQHLSFLMFAVTKIQIFESNSQQYILLPSGVKDVRRHKDTNFWKQFTTQTGIANNARWCSPSQRYKFLKAIHNCSSLLFFLQYDVRRHKDTNFWKQFTT